MLLIKTFLDLTISEIAKNTKVAIRINSNIGNSFFCANAL